MRTDPVIEIVTHYVRSHHDVPDEDVIAADDYYGVTVLINDKVVRQYGDYYHDKGDVAAYNFVDGYLVARGYINLEPTYTKLIHEDECFFHAWPLDPHQEEIEAYENRVNRDKLIDKYDAVLADIEKTVDGANRGYVSTAREDVFYAEDEAEMKEILAKVEKALKDRQL